MTRAAACVTADRGVPMHRPWLLVLLVLAACGGRDTSVLDIDASTGPIDGGGGECLAFGFECEDAADCCSGVCAVAPGGSLQVCGSPGAVCQPQGGPCESAL